MSELINNRGYRQKVLKELIMELHNGQPVEEVKERFGQLIEGLAATEISQMEQALIQEGMPVEEIQRLCDVHAAVLGTSVQQIHTADKGEEQGGHPVHTFQLENQALEALLKNVITPELERYEASSDREALETLSAAFQSLWEIDKHYSRKENLLFPIMEKHGITAPPKVMWGVDDEIRTVIKETRKLLSSEPPNKEEILEKAKEAVTRVPGMIFKEENILFPMILETFSEDEWIAIAEASHEIGYCLIDEPQRVWKPSHVQGQGNARNDGQQDHRSIQDGYVEFDAGKLRPEEINAIMNTLPFDITFVGSDGTVKYFTQGKERIFARAKTVLGRRVENCHPPASVHVVEKVVEELRSGKKDHEDFWIKMGDKYVLIRYYAVRNAEGEYLGIMEISQDIKDIQAITGEKRLLSE
ncbi:MAG TPA: DUF438 domain-containing protein [Desulfitobacterium dehalogenans]|uniref:DUF438 domain-containing protein n=1 Tax=Desulfitobacterium dehalogenans TaxID=36854 RepID=A0A7C6Z780_9FIRM|nr:DUF438 domain-containing protein [Desulfitobacterium dehalogenans]